MSIFKLNPLSVSINQVSLGNKKLTKSIFNQIELADCFTKDMDFSGEAIIGYVKDNDTRFLLWVFNSKLRRTNLKKYYELKVDLERNSLKNIEWFLSKIKLKLMENDEHEASLVLEDRERYVNLVNKTKHFLASLNDQQIYI